MADIEAELVRRGLTVVPQSARTLFVSVKILEHTQLKDLKTATGDGLARILQWQARGASVLPVDGQVVLIKIDSRMCDWSDVLGPDTPATATVKSIIPRALFKHVTDKVASSLPLATMPLDASDTPLRMLLPPALLAKSLELAASGASPSLDVMMARADEVDHADMQAVVADTLVFIVGVIDAAITSAANETDFQLAAWRAE
jgi:hypothetical protein